MAGMTEMVAQFRERQEIVVAAVDAIKAAREEIRGAAVDVRRAAEEFDTREFKLRQSYEKLDKAINSEAQRFNQWAFLKMGVLAGCVGAGAGVLFFFFSSSSVYVRRWYGWDFDEHRCGQLPMAAMASFTSPVTDGCFVADGVVPARRL